MRTTFSLFCLIALLAAATPAEAQLRQDLRQPAPAAVYESDGGQSSSIQNSVQQWISTMFSDERFQMSHSYEMSFSSFGGESASLGMYTNTMQWRFDDAWAARVDLSMAHDPLGSGSLGMDDGQGMRVFLRNAEVSYQPSENVQFRFQMRQSPYGSYAGPLGRSNFRRGLQPLPLRPDGPQ